MDKLLILVLPELAKNVPAIIIAAVAAASLWANAGNLKKRFIAVENTTQTVALAVSAIPSALEKLATHDVELARVRQELHDSNLIARSYVTRDEVRDQIGKQGGDLHTKVNELGKLVERLDERSKW